MYWLYQENRPLCQTIGLSDHRCQSGALELAVPVAMIDDLASLHGCLHLHHDKTEQTEAVHCLRVRREGFKLLITAVALGAWRDPDTERFNDDWLVVNDRPLCQLEQCYVSAIACPRGAHCVFRLPDRHWRKLNCRRTRLTELRRLHRAGFQGLGRAPVELLSPVRYDGPRADASSEPRLEIVRLRHRLRLRAAIDLADGDPDTPMVLAHVEAAGRIGRESASRTAIEQRPPAAHEPQGAL